MRQRTSPMDILKYLFKYWLKIYIQNSLFIFVFLSGVEMSWLFAITAATVTHWAGWVCSVDFQQTFHGTDKLRLCGNTYHHMHLTFPSQYRLQTNFTIHNSGWHAAVCISFHCSHQYSLCYNAHMQCISEIQTYSKLLFIRITNKFFRKIWENINTIKTFWIKKNLRKKLPNKLTNSWDNLEIIWKNNRKMVKKLQRISQYWHHSGCFMREKRGLRFIRNFLLSEPATLLIISDKREFNIPTSNSCSLSAIQRIRLLVHSTDL